MIGLGDDAGLVIQDLTVSFGTIAAVDDVTLEVSQGSVLALVGASGCGKSTMLRCVAGLVEPDRGKISWNGSDMTEVPTHRRDFGLMFQNHALFTHRSVAQNVAFGLKMADFTARDQDRRVVQLLEMVGLAGFADRSVEALSGGEAQRVALARALAPQPRLLLLDEPLASLDRARRVELNAELARLLRELGQTAIYVTHDQDEAFAVGDQVGVMHEGRLLRVDSPTNVWRDPRSEVVARFVGHSPIIDRDGKRFAVRSDALSLAADLDRVDVDGVVAACAFQGDRYEIVVEAGGQSWRFFNVDPVTIGAAIGLVIDGSRLAELTR